MRQIIMITSLLLLLVVACNKDTGNLDDIKEADIETVQEKDCH